MRHDTYHTIDCSCLTNILLPPSPSYIDPSIQSRTFQIRHRKWDLRSRDWPAQQLRTGCRYRSARSLPVHLPRRRSSPDFLLSRRKRIPAFRKRVANPTTRTRGHREVPAVQRCSRARSTTRLQKLLK